MRVCAFKYVEYVCACVRVQFKVQEVIAAGLSPPRTYCSMCVRVCALKLNHPILRGLHMRRVVSCQRTHPIVRQRTHSIGRQRPHSIVRQRTHSIVRQRTHSIVRGSAYAPSSFLLPDPPPHTNPPTCRLTIECVLILL